jgi:hypothetical protein
MASGDKWVYRGRPGGMLATSGTTDSARPITTPIHEAIVEDVILDHLHPKYSSDGYNVGMIKIRIFSVDNSRDSETLDWAQPIDATIQELPLIGELVIVQRVLGDYFYNRKVYLAHRIQENGMLNLSKQLDNRPAKLGRKITATQTEIQKEDHEFGQYFKPDNRVRPLKHFEGDVLIQGRMGHSIRFGSSQMDPSSKGMAPNIILRTGQAKDAETKNCTTDKVFGLTLEDINRDASSLWMTSDQTVPFEPITLNAGSFYRSILNPPQKFDKAQIILNSDRIILDAKKTHIMMFSNEEIYLNSFKRTSIDADESIILTANLDVQINTSRNIDNVADEDFTVKAGSDISMLAGEKISLVGKKIHLGGIQNDAEPVVGGTSLSIFLARLIQAIMGLGITPPQIPTYQSAGLSGPTINIPSAITPGTSAFFHVQTPTGPGVLMPQIVTALTALHTELVSPNPGSQKSSPFSGAPFNSNDVFIAMSNQDVTTAIVKNEFENGTQIKTENNQWLLSDSYYKVT